MQESSSMTVERQSFGDGLEYPDMAGEGRRDQRKVQGGLQAFLPAGSADDRARTEGLFGNLWRRFKARRRPAPPPLPLSAYLAIAVALFAFTALILSVLGRPLTCNCGEFRLWGGGPQGGDNSQHLTDWYSALHVVYGIVVFGVMWLTSRHWPWGWLVLVAIFAGAGWEIVENTQFMIARYGQGGPGAVYAGDSVPNALGDMLFVVGGFSLAGSLPGRWAAALAVGIEVATALAIRDSLVLGAITLLAPIASVTDWQTAA